VGYAKDGHVWMGADSAGTTEDGNQFILKTPKIHKEGEFLIGIAGHNRGMQLLQTEIDLSGITEKAVGISNWDILQVIAESLRECFVDHGYVYVKDGRELGDVFLIGFHGQLYEIQAEFDVLQMASTYHAIGAGDMVALGALHALASVELDGVGPEDHIAIALKAASKYRADVRSPYIIESI